MLKRLLVPVRGDGMVRSVVGHAAALAHRHRAHVVVAHCRTQPEELMPYSVPLPRFARDTILQQAKELADQQEQGVREQLHELAAEFGLLETDPLGADKATVEFVEEFGRMADVVKHWGRLADLIVVAKPDRDRNLGTNELKAGLFRAGRPVLMCPREGEAPADLGRHVAFGWNGSLEASRAVASTLDLAMAAESVTILSAGRGEPHGATTEELVAYLALRGVTAKPLRFDARNPGAALLEKTVEAGASMLVMGAYGHSHERETLFGGNTQTVVDTARIPVVLVH
jgi:nucleotide-binding universal stress UspA family protein